jgi:hypothetical protein
MTTFNWVNGSDTGGSSTTSISLAVGANTINSGDLVIAAISLYGSAAIPSSITPPDGTWTNLGTQIANVFGDGQAIVTYGKVMGAGQTGPYVFTWTTAVVGAGALIDYSGTNASPFDAFAGAASGTNTSSVSWVAPSVSPVGSTDTLVCCWASKGGTGTAPTLPGGFTSRYNNNSGSSTVPDLVIGDKVLSASGATGTATATGSNQGWGASSVALTPSGGAARTPTLALMGVG